jgi:hypothetical protein
MPREHIAVTDSIYGISKAMLCPKRNYVDYTSGKPGLSNRRAVGPVVLHFSNCGSPFNTFSSFNECTQGKYICFHIKFCIR